MFASTSQEGPESDTESLSSHDTDNADQNLIHKFPPPTPKPKSTPQYLQYSTFQFFIPLIYSFYKKEYILGANLIFIIILGYIVHRTNRPQSIDIYDLIDHIFIGGWIVSNAYIGLTVTNVSLQIGGIICAFMVISLSTLRHYWQVNSKIRILIHVAMHFFGMLGTMLILYGSDEISFKSASS